MSTHSVCLSLCHTYTCAGLANAASVGVPKHILFSACSREIIRGRKLSLMCKFTINNSSPVSPKRPSWRVFAAPAFQLTPISLPLPPRIHPSQHHYLWSTVMKHSHFQCFVRPSVIRAPFLTLLRAYWIKYPAVMENESRVVAYALAQCEKQEKWKSPCLARLYIYRQKTWFQISHARLEADTYCTPGDAGRHADSELFLVLSFYPVLQRVHAVSYFLSLYLYFLSLFLSPYLPLALLIFLIKDTQRECTVLALQKVLWSHFIYCLIVLFTSNKWKKCLPDEIISTWKFCRIKCHLFDHSAAISLICLLLWYWRSHLQNTLLVHSCSQQQDSFNSKKNTKISEQQLVFFTPFIRTTASR